MAPTFNVHVTRSPAEREEAFRLRYRVFVSELNRVPAFADHGAKQVRDPLDATAHILLARSGTEAIGTLRINFARDGVPHLERILGLPPTLIQDAATASVTSRAAVLGSERGGTVFARLARAVYGFALRNGITADWIVSRPELAGLYGRMGYHAVGATTRHPEVGQVQPLRLDLTDGDHLAAVRSPFLPVLREFTVATLAPKGPPMTDNPTRHCADLPSFTALVHELVEAFPQNALCRKVDAGTVTIADYHAFLNMIFHQTYEGPSLFALAGAHCDPRRHAVRDYLIEHAEEEKSHWEWVIDDLRSTGFAGPDPASGSRSMPASSTSHSTPTARFGCRPRGSPSRPSWKG